MIIRAIEDQSSDPSGGASSSSAQSVFSHEALSGQRVLITGGSRGIGSGIASYLGRHGAEVFLTSRSEDDAVAAAEELRKEGVTATGLELEVRDKASVDRLKKQLAEHGSHIDVLINNAGINIPEAALDVTEESWDTVQETNLKGTFMVSQLFARNWIEAGISGTIVNIASQAGLVAIENRAAYCSAKAGVIHLTRELAYEWAPRGIRVNAVAPTFVITPMTRPMLEDGSFLDKVLGMIPLGRIATVEDVAAAALFLMTPGASCITGHVLVVDGGWTIH